MKEPEIEVGILSRRTIEFVLCGTFLAGGREIPAGGVQRVEYSGGSILWNGVRHEGALLFRPAAEGAFFELRRVTIGVHFHWEREENQRFSGALRIIPDDVNGVCVAVNVIPVEEYLKSVISSEMSANASGELLKAHAVISRSWLLRQLADKGKHHAAESTRRLKTVVDGREVDEIVRWYDREDHTLFDVCADDHCQRYQGITRQTTPSVAEAVESTRGMALTYGGEVCDARFSKCCGGRSESFGNCWEETPHPYLEPVDDICGADGHIFCRTDDAAVLGQVLNGYDREQPDFYEWEVSYTPLELSALVRRKSGFDFGTIRSLRPLHRGYSGRITRLLVVGDRMEMVVGKELEIRRWLSDSHLRSSAFEVRRGMDGEFILHGHGWGHGVGLCQIGAAVMGAEGYDYQQILEHYFPKAILEKIYE